MKAALLVLCVLLAPGCWECSTASCPPEAATVEGAYVGVVDNVIPAEAEVADGLVVLEYADDEGVRWIVTYAVATP